jgi:hypothetical protein
MQLMLLSRQVHRSTGLRRDILLRLTNPAKQRTANSCLVDLRIMALQNKCPPAYLIEPKPGAGGLTRHPVLLIYVSRILKAKGITYASESPVTQCTRIR